MAGNQVWRLVANSILIGGTPVVAAYGPFIGAFIINPQLAADQGLPVPENLYVDIVGPAGTSVTATTSIIYPGRVFPVPAGALQVSVNAASTGHRFGGYVFQTAEAFQASLSTFPPSGPTTLQDVIASYLYQEYSDDDDLQAFVIAFNDLAQQYVDIFNGLNLPVYSGLSGPLLDWVAQGLYGFTRPVLPSGRNRNIGPLNTYRFNVLRLNQIKIIQPTQFYATTDDVFKRIMTWHLYRGDGRQFDIRWLKRRVQRFLTGINGTGGTTDQTYQVSITFGPDYEVDINLQSTRIYATGGAFYNISRFNTSRFNQVNTRSVMIPVSPLAPIFKAAMDAGVLEMPWQITQTVVNVS